MASWLDVPTEVCGVPEPLWLRAERFVHTSRGRHFAAGRLVGAFVMRLPVLAVLGEDFRGCSARVHPLWFTPRPGRGDDALARSEILRRLCGYGAVEHLIGETMPLTPMDVAAIRALNEGYSLVADSGFQQWLRVLRGCAGSLMRRHWGGVLLLAEALRALPHDAQANPVHLYETWFAWSKGTRRR